MRRWGLGCLMSEMITGDTPFSEDTVLAMCRKVLHSPIVVPPGATLSELSFITDLLQRGETRRLGFYSASDVAAHEYFKSSETSPDTPAE